MINLPDVTLVIPTTRAHDLARITALDLVSKVNFGGVLIYTDDIERMTVPGARYIKVEDWPDKKASGLFYYTEAAREITTSHALLMEWDAGACDMGMWSDEFLQYDYIGAPWGTGMCRQWPGYMVGNGGFALVTKRLVDFCYDEKFKIYTDMYVSCNHRQELEARGGFKWAPEDVARKFSYEGWTVRGPTIPKTRPLSFGYHAVVNWPAILDHADLITRAKILISDPHAKGKLNLLLRAAPWLRAEIGAPPPSQHSNSRLVIDRIRAQRAAIYSNIASQRGQA
jgi:hypothetical protein